MHAVLQTVNIEYRRANLSEEVSVGPRVEAFLGRTECLVDAVLGGERLLADLMFWRLPPPQPQGRDVRVSGGTLHGVRGGGTPRITPPQVVSLSAGGVTGSVAG